MKKFASLVFIAALGLGVAGCSDMETTTGGGESSAAPVASDGAAPAPAEPAPAAEEVPSEYKSALKSAETYSKMMHMSKMGIFEQLTNENGGKFSVESAQYAIDNIKADWNANALAAAKSYQETMAMSPEAIREQLTSEFGGKFTPEEAEFAVANLP